MIWLLVAYAMFLYFLVTLITYVCFLFVVVGMISSDILSIYGFPKYLNIIIFIISIFWFITLPLLFLYFVGLGIKEYFTS